MKQKKITETAVVKLKAKVTVRFVDIHSDIHGG